MPYPLHVKRLAYELDPGCWMSYSGLPKFYKRDMDERRSSALALAEVLTTAAGLHSTPDWSFIDITLKKPETEMSSPPDMARSPQRASMPPMKIAMMLHFYAVCEPFAPEKTRRSPAYAGFVRELLRDGMIERPTDMQRVRNPGWAYRATRKGCCYVEALKAVRLPVAVTPEWEVPK